ncbi:hypothetical protein [Nesterenkonia pannonica]|uniref:hypothetical protein n=1 Tax=Nesterenkonia pannonica TaxID=1548602 RepID=UPI0021649BC4|nr:hypothetical protein [Nesterenkonia pannonica]
MRQFNQHTSRSLSERRLTDDAVGAFFGFALVQAASAVSVRLTSWGWDIPGVSPACGRSSASSSASGQQPSTP